MIRVTAKEIRGKSKEELLAELQTLKAELLRIRICKATKTSPASVRGIKVVKKSIATVMATMHKAVREALKEEITKSGKKMPKDLITKTTTRAQRRALTKKELSIKNNRGRKLAALQAKRVYALRA